MPLKEATESKGTTKPHSELVGIAEAARLLSVSVSTLYGWVWQRRIPFVKLGRALRFEVSDLQAFVRQNRVDARRDFKS